jgi:hypothetical protein
MRLTRLVVHLVDLMELLDAARLEPFLCEARTKWTAATEDLSSRQLESLTALLAGK